MKKYVGIVLIIFVGCVNKPNNKYIKSPASSKEELSIHHVKLDTIQLDSIHSSYMGFSNIESDVLLFIDEMFCNVYIFNKEGEFLERHLGQGEGPMEIPTKRIQAYVPLNNKGHLFIGSSSDYHTFNAEWERQRSSIIDWNKKNNRREMLKNPKPEMRGLYSPVYFKFLLKEKNGFVFFPVHSQHPKFNFVNSKDYYQNSRIIAKMDYKSGEVVQLLGRYSSIFQEYEFLPHFSLINFDISDDDRFYVGYEPDSLIYVYNKDYEVEQVFGRSGREMNTQYQEIRTLNSFRSDYKERREEKGFYNWIEYNDEHDLLFRNYKKGEQANTNGIQIYRKQQLIGDFDVPPDFDRIIGNIGPFFYSNIVVDEAHENMKIYRFKIDF